MRAEHFIVPLIAGVVLIGCAATPQVASWRPWYRVTGRDEQVPKPGEALRIVVSGKTEPLIGDEALFQAQMKERLADLLARRGYQIVDSGVVSECRLIYLTSAETALRMSSTSYFSSRSSSWLASAIGSTYSWGQGVRYASGLRTASSSSSQNSVDVFEQTAFVHTIAIEVRDRADGEVWKGEARWKSGSLELTHGLITALQLLASQLPSQPADAPQVRRVKETHASVYYRLYCNDVAFSCPALPNNIWFPIDLDGDLPKAVRDHDALEAYVDLVSTAEYSLSLGPKSKPWSRAMLGGKYRIGKDGKTTLVLVELRGSRTGYEVSRAWKATDTEFADFETRLAKWRADLRRYYDVYVE